MTGFQITSLVTVGIFYLVVMGVGFWAGRSHGAGKGSEELLLAGRRLPLFVAILTLTATWVGGGYINGTAEAVYGNGLVWAQAPWGYAISLVLGAVVFVRIMHRHRFTTMLDPFERRYGRPMAAVLFLPALMGEVFWSAAILTALGTTFSMIVDIDLRVAIIVSATCAIAYTLAGGLWAVAYTDVIQLFFILAGVGLAVPFALDKAGGFATAIGSYADHFGPMAGLIPPLNSFTGAGGETRTGWIWLDTALLLICGGIPWQVYFQRILACPDERTAVRVSYWACLGVLILAVPPMLIGVAGAAIDWTAIGVSPPENAAMMLPHALKYLTPPAVCIFGLAAVAAAVMSSVDSSILSASTLFGWNVYRPLIRPGASEREMKLVLRLGIIAVGAMATLLALKAQSVYSLFVLCSDLVYVILFPQLVMALYFKKATVFGAAAGVAVAFTLRLGGGEPLLGLPAWLPYPMQDPEAGILFPFRTFSMLANFGTITLVSLLTTRWCSPRLLSAASPDDSGSS